MEGDDCIFCQIVRREAEARIIYEDEYIISFFDKFPSNMGHMLVLPKAHRPSFDDIALEESKRMFPVAQKVNKALRSLFAQQQKESQVESNLSPLRVEGVNLLLCDGATAGQEVFHAHLHIIPRYKNDGGFLRKSRSQKPITSESQLDQLAIDLRNQIAILSIDD